MEDHCCPNYRECILVNDKDFLSNSEDKAIYKSEYCESKDKKWLICKRYMTKEEINFCPDFVLPDTGMSVVDIIEKFDNETFEE